MTQQSSPDGVAGLRGALSVMIVDDHMTLAQAMVAAFQMDRRIGGVVAYPDVASAVAALAAHPVDVVLLDVAMPGADGIAQIPAIREVAPEVRIIILTGRSDRSTLQRAAAAGASGFVSKERPMAEVVSAVLSAPATGMRLSHDQIEQLAGGEAEPAVSTPGLSKRELEVLRLLGAGTSVAEISRELFLSVHTCRDHLKSIFKKLGARSQLEAVAIARQRNIL